MTCCPTSGAASAPWDVIALRDDVGPLTVAPATARHPLAAAGLEAAARAGYPTGGAGRGGSGSAVVMVWASA
jgi:hypothetical protein